MEHYLWIRYLHIGCVALSGAGFVLRGVLMLRASPLLGRRWVRTVPHGVDSLLLASGLYLAWRLGQYPLVDGWLTAKFFALVTYITLGSVALRYGPTRRVRATAWLAALSAYAYLVSVARGRAPWPF